MLLRDRRNDRIGIIYFESIRGWLLQRHHKLEFLVCLNENQIGIVFVLPTFLNWRCWHLSWNIRVSTILWSSSPKTLMFSHFFSFARFNVNGHSRNHGQVCKVAFFHVLNCAWVKMHNSHLEVQTESTKQDHSLLSNYLWGALSWRTLRYQYKYTNLYSHFNS